MKNQFAEAVRRAVENAYLPERGDAAMKVYFYPFSAVFFSTDEFDSCLSEDEITIRPDKTGWLITEGGKRLASFVASLNLKSNVHLTVVVYGMVNGHDVLYHVDARGNLTIHPPLACLFCPLPGCPHTG